MTDGSAIQDRQSPPSAASLDIIFHPRNVAVVGASAAAAGSTYSLGFGTGYISSLKARGFQGPIYPVNPKYREVLGLPCYPSLLAIPGPVDHVVVCIPVARVLELIDDCVRKGVRSVQFFTAGFAEAGEDGAALERELVARARRGGVRVLLNCVGIYCPRSGLCLNTDISPLLPLEPGPVAIISQSGGNTHYLAGWGALRGLQYSKVISYGNAADVDESELLEYLAWDPETEIIGAYIEGVRDGRRFARALRQAAARKPVVVWKAGQTEAGIRAARSHTASLAGSAEIFDSLCRQAGALRAGDMDELVDLLVALRFLGPVSGPGVLVVGPGGGASVLFADVMERQGLRLPPIPPTVERELRRAIPYAGVTFPNPIDVPNVVGETALLREAIRIAGRMDSIDVVFVHGNMGMAFPMPVEATTEAIVEARKLIGKPVAMVLRPHLQDLPRLQELPKDLEHLWRAGIPVFFSVGRAARTVAKLLAWRAERGEL